MKLKGTILLAALAMTLTACANVDVTKTSAGFRDPTNPNKIEILKTVPLDRPYEELATVTVTGFQPDETAKMHNAVRAKSAAVGADAVVLTQEGIVQSGFSMERWATGVAIGWKTTAR